MRLRIEKGENLVYHINVPERYTYLLGRLVEAAGLEPELEQGMYTLRLKPRSKTHNVLDEALHILSFLGKFSGQED